MREGQNFKVKALVFDSSRAGWVRYALLLLLVSTAVRSPTLFLHNFNVDEASYTTIATQMMSGDLYFREVVDHKPPAVYYIYAAIYAVAGRYQLNAVHVTLFLVVAATGLLIALCGQRLFGDRRSGRLAGLLYVVVGAFGPPMDFQAANAELFMNLPTVGGLLLYLRARQSGNRALGYLLAGVLISSGALIKLQAGFVAAAVLLHLLLSHGPKLAGLCWGLAGLMLPFAAHALAYHLLGAWDEMMWGMLYNTKYVGASDLGWQLKRAVIRTAVYAAIILPLLVPAVAYLARERGTPRDRAVDSPRMAWLFLLAWLLSAAAAVSIGGRYFMHYYIQLMPVLALMGAPKLLEWTARRPLVRRVEVALITLSAIAWITVSCLDRTLRPHEAWHQDRYQAVGAYVRSHTRPNDRIFVWGNSPTIYFQSQRLMATRYQFVNYQLGLSWGSPYQRVGAPPPPPELVAEETWGWLLQDLRNNKPELIIDAASGKLDEFDDHPISRHPRIARVVARHYRHEATVLGVPIYRRR